MKKTTISALIINVFTLIACIVSIVKKTSDTEYLLFSIYLLIASTLVNIVFYILFDKKHQILLLIPALLNYALFIICQSLMSNQIGSIASQSNYEVLSLLINIAYIVSLVYALKKQAKWASIVIIVFNSLLILTNLTVVSTTILNAENSVNMYGYLCLAYIFTFTSQLVYFVNPLLKKKENQEETAE